MSLETSSRILRAGQGNTELQNLSYRYRFAYNYASSLETSYLSCHLHELCITGFQVSFVSGTEHILAKQSLVILVLS